MTLSSRGSRDTLLVPSTIAGTTSAVASPRPKTPWAHALGPPASHPGALECQVLRLQACPCAQRHTPWAPVEAAFALALSRPRSLRNLAGPLLGVKASRSSCLLGAGLVAKGKIQLGLGCGHRWSDPGWTRHTPGPLGEAHVPPELCESEERKAPSHGTHFSRCRSYVAGGEEAMRVHGGQCPCTAWAPPPRATLVLTQRKYAINLPLQQNQRLFIKNVTEPSICVHVTAVYVRFRPNNTRTLLQKEHMLV